LLIEALYVSLNQPEQSVVSFTWKTVATLDLLHMVMAEGVATILAMQNFMLFTICL